MTITANGKERVLTDGASVDMVLRELRLAPERVVVEHNGAALHRDRYAETVLREGDRLEIAQMVGGG
ncbi:MAG: sulfur carrier protein ThiS [Candidatus Eremiobacteraeota bacterium]|nr:sulfur carrier protein ThiS [Candidatus Eremiobacteraeota bacterium]MBV8203721.1 sulfur carrier protein ThiS [Candidatus Eremiobacteraeota bacterium]MBV8263947.1 sulfur carrier protein ThiS [Candidatus Eremiobacteraeota bacterium]MBV8339130.1 sulfur carrier protein ThiS [Candidatus Eremiobacteraeota bacterium]MBV8459635.1 sulfur carrier protein ThiS [Candidatus Eremiobacteraeota bacterium]